MPLGADRWFLIALASTIPQPLLAESTWNVRQPWTPLTLETGIFLAEQPAPAPHLARPEGRAVLTHMC